MLSIIAALIAGFLLGVIWTYSVYSETVRRIREESRRIKLPADNLLMKGISNMDNEKIFKQPPNGKNAEEYIKKLRNPSEADKLRGAEKVREGIIRSQAKRLGIRENE